MAKLDTSQRKALPSHDFAGPDRSFPIPDASHARDALARAHFAQDPAEIRAKVHRKFPGIDRGAAVKQAVMRKMGGM